ncbi:MAG: PadR family transcriptional regulator [Ignavibacteriae bacterium]|nr:PadR family transcriptional regulator [Ignavibacteriota bacterium]
MEISADIIRGHIDTIVLKLLLNEDMYGYQISKTIHSASAGAYELKEATMYSSLKRLESDGCITWYWGDETQGGRRKYYKITEKGNTTFAENKKNWEFAKSVIDKLL